MKKLSRRLWLSMLSFMITAVFVLTVNPNVLSANSSTPTLVTPNGTKWTISKSSLGAPDYSVGGIFDNLNDGYITSGAIVDSNTFIYTELLKPTDITGFKLYINDKRHGEFTFFDADKNELAKILVLDNQSDNQYYELQETIPGVTYLQYKSAINTVTELNFYTIEQSNPEPGETVESRAILTLYITGGQIKEYDLSIDELNAFITWFDAKDAGTGSGKYKFTKSWNKGPFKTRSEYVVFDKIIAFDVDEYEVVNP